MSILDFIKKKIIASKIGVNQVSNDLDNLIAEMRHFYNTANYAAHLYSQVDDDFLGDSNSMEDNDDGNHRRLLLTVNNYKDKLNHISQKIFFIASLRANITPISSHEVRKTHLTEDTIKLSKQATQVNAIKDSLTTLIIKGNLLERTKPTSSIIGPFIEQIKENIKTQN